MSIEALIDKSASRLQILVWFIAGPGVLLLGVGLVSGAMVFAGMGVAFLFGGYLTWRRVRSNREAMHALLKDPSQVAQIVPIVQTVQGGIITHYPVVLVTTDGRPYRIATWAKSVEEAVAPFRERFPHAAGFSGDSVFAPDDGFGARFKLIGFMFLSIFVGFVAAALFSLPRVISDMRRFDAAYELQLAKNTALTTALKAVGSDEVKGRWSDCKVDSVGDGIDVRLSGALDSTREREGDLRSRRTLTLSDGYELMVYRRDPFDVLFNAMTGARGYSSEPRPEKELAVVGARRGDELHARLVELPTGKVLCEGMAPLGIAGKTSSTQEDSALAAAVARPFCALVDCSGLAPEPDAQPAVAPQPTAEAKVPERKGPSAKGSSPSGSGKGLTPDSIRAVVQAANGRSRFCYERALSKQPSLQGTLTMAFTIGKDGKVTSAKGSGFPNQNVTDCVVKVFQGLRFAAPADGKPTPVKYPIVFRGS